MNEQDLELISAYADGEADGSELKRVNERLSTSQEWRDELAKIREMKVMMASAPRLELPDDLRETLLRQFEEGVPPSSIAQGSFMSRFWVLAGSLATAAVFLGFYVGVRVMNPPAEIPLSALMAAHSRTGLETTITDRIQSASYYSREVKSAHVP